MHDVCSFYSHSHGGIFDTSDGKGLEMFTKLASAGDLMQTVILTIARVGVADTIAWVGVAEVVDLTGLEYTLIGH